MKEKTTIEIREAESGHYVIDMKLENGTIWLTAHQIAQLFDVFISKVTINIISIYKNDILSDETYKLHKYTNKKTIECHVELYNLDVVIALAYRINSPKSKAFRKWIITYLTKKPNKPEIHILINTFSSSSSSGILN